MTEQPEHQPMPIFTPAMFCNCSEAAADWDDSHLESDEDGNTLCSKEFHGTVCTTCQNANDDGPTWLPSAVEWPCPHAA
jgi:hypothetical protein